jgi:7-cyano-7-deazaguanine synthase
MSNGPLHSRDQSTHGAGTPPFSPLGLLLSGGLDSAILLGCLLESGRDVQPFYVRSGLAWQTAELAAVQQLTAHFAGSRLAPLVVLEMPVDDLYGDHWGLTGRSAPDRSAPDDAMYLPGRNPLLLLKVMLWCGLHGVESVALASLATNPFADATAEFFDRFESAVQMATGASVRIVRPFEGLDKRQVLFLGRGYPLEHTLSCVQPVGDLHCGRCNKCGERQAAFLTAKIHDRTRYARVASQPTLEPAH